jgi:quercetin dioxygenase-like cupin family protein
MKIIRLYTGADGKSHFEEVEAAFTGDGMGTTAAQNASGVVFRRAPAGHVIDWHPAPRRQYVTTLSGSWEIEASDGSKRVFRPGDVMLAEDLTGQGHVSRVLGGAPHVFMTVPLK